MNERMLISDGDHTTDAIKLVTETPANLRVWHWVAKSINIENTVTGRLLVQSN